MDLAERLVNKINVTEKIMRESTDYFAALSGILSNTFLQDLEKIYQLRTCEVSFQIAQSN